VQEPRSAYGVTAVVDLGIRMQPVEYPG